MNARTTWTRYIGLKPMVGAKVKGEPAATPVVIINEDGTSVELKLEDDDDFAAFLVGNLPTDWRDATKEDEDNLANLVTKWQKVRKGSRVSETAITRHNEDDEHVILRVAISFEGVKPGDKVGVLTGSRGTIALKALAERAQTENIGLYQIHTRHLHDRRADPEDDTNDAQILAELTRENAPGVYQVRPSDATAAQIGKLFAARQHTQKTRVAHGNRVLDIARLLNLAMKRARAKGNEFTFDQAAEAVGVKVNDMLASHIVRRRKLLAKIKAGDATDAQIEEYASVSEKIGRLKASDRYTQTLEDARKYLAALTEGQVPAFEDVFKFATAANVTWVALMNEEKQIEAEMSELLLSLPIGHVIMGVKGVGPAIGGGIIGLILDPRRFEREPVERELELHSDLNRILTEADYENVKQMLAQRDPEAVNPDKTNGFSRIVAVRKFCLDPEGLNDPAKAALLQQALEVLKELKTFNSKDKAKARLRSYAGCAPHDGKFHRARREGTKSCNRDLRQRLYQLGSMWVKRYKNPSEEWVWALRLKENLASYREKHPEPIQVDNGKGKMVWRYKDGHVLKMAMWKTISEFLDWLFDQWRGLQKFEEEAPGLEAAAK